VRSSAEIMMIIPENKKKRKINYSDFRAGVAWNSMLSPQA